MPREPAVFIRNIDFRATSAEVEEAFSKQIGGVLRVYLLRSDFTESHKGCGFVEFENEHYQRIALSGAQSIVVRNRRVLIAPVRPKSERPIRFNATEFS